MNADTTNIHVDLERNANADETYRNLLVQYELEEKDLTRDWGNQLVRLVQMLALSMYYAPLCITSLYVASSVDNSCTEAIDILKPFLLVHGVILGVDYILWMHLVWFSYPSLIVHIIMQRQQDWRMVFRVYGTFQVAWLVIGTCFVWARMTPSCNTSLYGFICVLIVVEYVRTILSCLVETLPMLRQET